KEPPSRLRFIPLKVSAPFHCSLMKPAEEKMRIVLEDLNFENARHPIAQNVTAQLETKGTELREQIIRQISAPVRWVECVTHLKNKGLSTFIECGSGKVLSGLVKKIVEGEVTVLGTNSLEDLKIIESQLQ
ncbi:MAG: ACP S-malonyltransferase, partial [Bdellovibrionales bacterium]|nr:ACP S-malonyltransferase [Bdellovibrionales bacterium]